MKYLTSFLCVFIFNINNCWAIFSSEAHLMESLKQSGMSHIAVLNHYNGNKLKIHTLDEDGLAKTEDNVKVSNLPEIGNSEDSDFQRIDELSYWEKGYRNPVVAVKVSDSLLCFAYSTQKISADQGVYKIIRPELANLEGRMDTSRYDINQIDFSWYSGHWKKCIIFPYELEDIIRSMKDIMETTGEPQIETDKS